MGRPIDTLTGLISGVELNSEMEALIAKGDDFVLILLDIDGLLVLNRDYGHEAGDEVFRLIAKHLSDIFPLPYLAFRDTRDQFDVLLPKCSKEEAFLCAEQARKLINEEKLNFLSTDKIEMTQSVSLGISSYPDDGDRAADILRRADSALLRAKKSGRNRVCLAKDEKLTPKTSHYTSAQLEKLSLVAKKEDVGESVLLREALDDLLRKYDTDLF